MATKPLDKTQMIQVLARACILASALAGVAVSQSVVSQPTQATSLSIELAALESVLRPFAPAPVSVDSAFAAADVAPAPLTSTLRPSTRHRALLDSLRIMIPSGARHPLVVRASAPSIAGNRATICVTVLGDTTWNLGHGGFYETVSLVLTLDGTRWRVTKRTILGV